MGLDWLLILQLTVLQEGTCRLQQPCALQAVALPISGIESAVCNVAKENQPTHGSGRVKIITSQ